MSGPAISVGERESLDDYERGYVDGLWAYAWWKDGVAYVGSTGTMYALAVDRFFRESGRRSASNPANSPRVGDAAWASPDKYPAKVVEQPVTPGREEGLPSTAGDRPTSSPASEPKED